MRTNLALRYVFVVSMIVALVFSVVTPHAYAAKDKQAPTAPTGLKVTGVTETTVALAWNAATDNVKVADYWVYQGTTLKGKTTSLSYSVTGLSPGKTYSFSVKAADAAWNVSPSSNAVTVTTLVTPTAPAPEPSPTPTPTPTPSAAKVVIGYYSGWSTYSGKQVADLDGSQLTHINYAFANIGPDLKIAVGDSYADIEKRFPDDTGTEPFFGNFNQLLKLKQRYPHLKTLISVGGWSWSGKFSDVALSDASRTAFADSVVAFLLKYGFDGVDMDWEYPVSGGMPENVRRPEDKQNFTLLMQKLREKLDAQKAKDGKTYLLSFAGAAGSYYLNNVEAGKLQASVDFVNIMSYDIHGTWESKTGLNAPLYKDPASGFAYDMGVQDAVQLYLNAGVPAGKLVMGVPFYGYKYDNVTNSNNGLYQTYSGGTSLSYGEIVAKYLNQGYTRYFHTASKVPYLFNGTSFISYDDPESMGYKAAYIKNTGIAGAMIWTLPQDNANRDLLTALYKGLQ
ncbi:glycosyl hydrolase family 18 protein [Paenibacillus sp. GD4]|uniref:glycosyl hydrolase family 18 protein n=1 Tax=Paenibacillus sp. GD4 TaxID=3068890 RepID=UPI002796958F|nr:glycosyl hydrolase family 18 protein [Paenibacillus sp. GD4]MDQ1911453.1 glycosyl hydrolase family 18 protein [Paenibacillus sp. GD4]